MFAVQLDAVRIEQAADLHDQGFVQRRRAAQGERQAVAEEGIAFGEMAQRPAERAADVEPVFRRDFLEIDGRVRCVLQRALERPPQAETGTVNGAVRTHALELQRAGAGTFLGLLVARAGTFLRLVAGLHLGVGQEAVLVGVHRSEGFGLVVLHRHELFFRDLAVLVLVGRGHAALAFTALAFAAAGELVALAELLGNELGVGLGQRGQGKRADDRSAHSQGQGFHNLVRHVQILRGEWWAWRPWIKRAAFAADLRPVVKEKLPARDAGVLPSAHASAATVSPTFPAAQADAMLRCNATYGAIRPGTY